MTVRKHNNEDNDTIMNQLRRQLSGITLESQSLLGEKGVEVQGSNALCRPQATTLPLIRLDTCLAVSYFWRTFWAETLSLSWGAGAWAGSTTVGGKIKSSYTSPIESNSAEVRSVGCGVESDGWVGGRRRMWSTADVVDVSSDGSMIGQSNGVGYGSTDWNNLTR